MSLFTAFKSILTEKDCRRVLFILDEKMSTSVSKGRVYYCFDQAEYHELIKLVRGIQSRAKGD